jgi:molecular chaperone GrpE (heat shock protein)
MSVERIPAMMEKLEHLTEGMSRLEALISREINDLKSEQIADLKRQNERLGDDQRRAWEAIRTLENKQNQYYGGVKIVHAVVATVSGLLGAALASVATKFLK